MVATIFKFETLVEKSVTIQKLSNEIFKYEKTAEKSLNLKIC